MSNAAGQTEALLPPWLRELYPFQSRRIRQPGGCQHYIDEGSGHPVVMLHGNPTWSFYYRDLVRSVTAAGMRAVVPDHLGCGLSEKPQNWSYRLADHIDNAQRLIDRLEIDQFSLVVHDWGGAIGMGVATRWSGRVKRIVILNTAAFRLPRMPRRIALCRMPVIGELLVRGLNGFAGPATRMTTVHPLSRKLRQAYLWPYRSWKDRVAIARFVQDIPMRTNHPSYETLVAIENGLEALRDKPILVAWGGQDWCFNGAFFEEWQRRFPTAETRWNAHAGHYVLEDGGAQLRAELVRFLTADKSPSA